MASLSLESLQSAGVEIRKQCGIPLDDKIICPEEAVGEVQIPLEDGMVIDMPICEGHVEFLQNNFKNKFDNA